MSNKAAKEVLPEKRKNVVLISLEKILLEK